MARVERKAELRLRGLGLARALGQECDVKGIGVAGLPRKAVIAPQVQKMGGMPACPSRIAAFQEMEDAALATFDRNFPVLDALPAARGDGPEAVRIDAGQARFLQSSQDLQDQLAIEVKACLESFEESGLPRPAAVTDHFQGLQDKE